ncbi:MAG: hypothetical protein KAH17_05730 [Bacteroidales bacterium]|nr:hypothetical protein [Bacteroidales bacterium]
MKKHIAIIISFFLLTISVESQSQAVQRKLVIPEIDWTDGWAVGLKLSTTGPGLEGIKVINKNWNARLGFSLLPLHIKTDIDQAGLALNVDSRIRTGGINLQADFHVSEWYYFTGGLWLNLVKADLEIQLSDELEFGDIAITPEQIGTFTVLGKTGWPITPYLGFGFGNPMPSDSRKYWFNVEVGAWYHHKPKFDLDAVGMISPTANADNEAALRNNFKSFRFYPVISIQGTYRIF